MHTRTNPYSHMPLSVRFTLVHMHPRIQETKHIYTSTCENTHVSTSSCLNSQMAYKPIHTDECSNTDVRTLIPTTPHLGTSRQPAARGSRQVWKQGLAQAS